MHVGIKLTLVPITSNMLPIQRNTALRITILYLIFGLTWIFVSDLFDSNLTGEFNWFQLLKGSLFVVSTAVLFYFTIRSISNKLDFSELILKELFDKDTPSNAALAFIKEEVSEMW